MQKICNDKVEAIRKLGPERAKLLHRRIDEQHDAASLADMRALRQARCHELKANRVGQLSVDLKHPYRLIFEVADDPIPMLPNGGLDWESVQSIRILNKNT
jgi:plasmid maintenance system killer protein